MKRAPHRGTRGVRATISRVARRGHRGKRESRAVRNRVSDRSGIDFATNAQRGRLRLVQLGWAIPTSFVSSAPIWWISQWGWCHNDGYHCLTFSTLTISISALFPLFGILISGSIASTVFLVAPWTKNRTLRRRVAVAIGALPLSPDYFSGHISPSFDQRARQTAQTIPRRPRP